ncbi:MAG: 4Fe-4S binding protein [Sedimentisphaerales bacterium]
MVKKSLNNLSAKIIGMRMWIQTAFLVVWLDPLGFRMHTICSPVFHCYACPLSTFACPIGVIAQFGALHMFPFVAIGMLVTVGVLFGTLVCGWVCPFGLLQDLAGNIPTKKFNLPKYAGHFRFVVLIVTVLAIPYFFGENHWLFIWSSRRDFLVIQSHICFLFAFQSREMHRLQKMSQTLRLRN